MLTLPLETARRFILGKQGLWPGRRWQGLPGLTQAMREIDYLQLDPLQIIARSHDIQLHSRVFDTTPGLWETAAYDQRGFFDWGGWLATRPMDDLPHWRVVMQRERDGHVDCDPRIVKMGRDHAETIYEMRAILREQETVSNRDFSADSRIRTAHYRGRKDSSLALYYLWRTGEIMTHHRDNFERHYALTAQVAPAELITTSDDETADRYLFEKEISFAGLSRLNRTADAFHRGVPFSKKEAILDALLADGRIIEVKVEGWRPLHYALAADLPLLDDLLTGRIPQAWAPLGPTTTDEAVFLAPLDPVCARGRAKQLFDFDYVWEVYKPEDKRRYGYYTLPVLWGDRLVARFDSKLDRDSNTYVLLGFWPDDDALSDNPDFAAAFARGLHRFTRFLGATNLDATALPAPLRHALPDPL